MSIHSEKKSIKPFKTVTVEYFEELKSSVKVSQRQIRVVTTTRIYNSGSSRGEPIVSVAYEYM